MHAREFLAVCALLLGLAHRVAAEPPPIAVTLPTQFTIQLPVTQPSACWQVPRPADGRLTAEVVGADEWSVCIGDQRCPGECLGQLRRASTEALTQGAAYYVRVHSLSPGTAATLRIYPTSTGSAGLPPPPPAAAAAMVGRWRYQSGSFSDLHVYAADGTVSAPSAPAAHATWTVEGTEIVSRWHNRWENRLALPAPGARTLSGTAIGPNGERQSITLTREGEAAAPASASIVGSWRYQSGSFSDIHVYHADGTVSAPNAPEAGARWHIEGEEVVSEWHNRWTNRVQLPLGDSARGVAISPSGERYDFTLTRM